MLTLVLGMPFVSALGAGIDGGNIAIRVIVRENSEFPEWLSVEWILESFMICLRVVDVVEIDVELLVYSVFRD